MLPLYIPSLFPLNPLSLFHPIHQLTIPTSLRSHSSSPYSPSPFPLYTILTVPPLTPLTFPSLPLLTISLHLLTMSCFTMPPAHLPHPSSSHQAPLSPCCLCACLSVTLLAAAVCPSLSFSSVIISLLASCSWSLVVLIHLLVPHLLLLFSRLFFYHLPVLPPFFFPFPSVIALCLLLFMSFSSSSTPSALFQAPFLFSSSSSFCFFFLSFCHCSPASSFSCLFRLPQLLVLFFFSCFQGSFFLFSTCSSSFFLWGGKGRHRSSAFFLRHSTERNLMP